MQSSFTIQLQWIVDDFNKFHSTVYVEAFSLLLQYTLTVEILATTIKIFTQVHAAEIIWGWGLFHLDWVR